MIIDQEGIALVLERHRDSLGPHFQRCGEIAREDLESGRWPKLPLAKGDSEPDQMSKRLVEVILEELRVMLCESDRKYEGVKAKGEKFSQTALPLLAGYVVGVCGVPASVATAGVAFVSLLVFKLGSEVFCKVMRD